MNAEEARKMTSKGRTSAATTDMMNFVYRQIEAKAAKGENSLTHPLVGFQSPLSEIEKEAIYDRLLEEGYKVKHHPDPDPGHPCSHPYTEISW